MRNRTCFSSAPFAWHWTQDGARAGWHMQLRTHQDGGLEVNVSCVGAQFRPARVHEHRGRRHKMDADIESISSDELDDSSSDELSELD
eukprot:10857871-Alexandrium_andersonii.AAC.1